MSTLMKCIAGIDRWLQKLLIVLMALLLVDVSWQVITRFVLPTPSSFTEEMARFLLIWIGLLGSAHAYRHKMHLGVDIVVRALDKSIAMRVNQLVQLITFIFAIAVLVYGGSKLVLLAYHLDQKSAAMQINMGLVYVVLPLSGVLLALYCIEQFFEQALPAHKQTSNKTPTDVNQPNKAVMKEAKHG